MRPLIKFITCLITLFITVLSCTEKTSMFQKPALIAIYDAPAKVWESEALPIGNGYMGAMIYGDVHTDIIQVNEKTVIPMISEDHKIAFKTTEGTTYRISK